MGKTLTGEEAEYWECKDCSGYMKERMIEWMNKNWTNSCCRYVTRREGERDMISQGGKASSGI